MRVHLIAISLLQHTTFRTALTQSHYSVKKEARLILHNSVKISAYFSSFIIVFSKRKEYI